MDLQERRQLDVARLQVAKAKVKARTRPWRYIFAIVLAVVAAAVSVQARVTANLSDHARSESLLGPLGKSGNLGLSYGAAAAFCLLAGVGTIGLGNKAREVLERTVGLAHAAVVRFAVIVVGGLLTIVITLGLFNIPITQVLVGGAVTGVVVGIAAQQSLANIFAGIVLLMARPFRVGDQVGIRSGALSGLLEGTVTEISITYVSLLTANGPVHVPNSQVLAAAVGPAGAIPSPPGSPAPPSDAGASPAEQTASPAGAGAPPAGQTGPPGGVGASSAGAGATPAGPEVAALAGASQASAEVHDGRATTAPPGASGVSAEPSGPTQPEPPGSGSEPDGGHQPS